jgi:hypothetical protein
MALHTIKSSRRLLMSTCGCGCGMKKEAPKKKAKAVKKAAKKK